METEWDAPNTLLLLLNNGQILLLLRKGYGNFVSGQGRGGGWT